MSEGNEFNEAATWRRWRDGRAVAGDAAAEPDALILAAYAENRLGRPGIDPETDPAIAAVEAWLAEHPEALDDIAAARAGAESLADEASIARAQALIAEPGGNVVTLRPARALWHSAVAWSGIAASMVAAILIGFSLGSNDVVDLSVTGQNPAVEQALIGSPGTILTTDDEDFGI
jgi:hypothetical protein